MPDLHGGDRVECLLLSLMGLELKGLNMLRLHKICQRVIIQKGNRSIQSKLASIIPFELQSCEVRVGRW